MILDRSHIEKNNRDAMIEHRGSFQSLCSSIVKFGMDPEHLVNKLSAFQVSIPSWALGAGSTRFGKFPFPGEPGSLADKIKDVGILHALTGMSGSISLHIPWDIPDDHEALNELVQKQGLKIDSVNSNTFQDPIGSPLSYRHGSLCNVREKIREQAIQHNIEVIEMGKKIGAERLSLWLADGSNFPGQHNFRTALENVGQGLSKIYGYLPDNWQMLIEYKPYEPNFYSTVVHDWGTALQLATDCGDKALVLVDLGHHLPNSNIEQIVSNIIYKDKLGGFHLNDSKYGDDDLTVGCMNPYMLFLIFNEAAYAMEYGLQKSSLTWMIDASHNIKDPLEDLLQSIEAIAEAYAKSLLVDQRLLAAAQHDQDVVMCQEILQGAYRTDVRPLLREARIRGAAALDPLKTFRTLGIRKKLIEERGKNSIASGL